MRMINLKRTSNPTPAVRQEPHPPIEIKISNKGNKMTDNTPETPEVTPKSFWRRKLTAGNALLLFYALILIGPPLYSCYRIYQIPYIDHPFDIEAFGTVKITPAENAFFEYQQATSKMVKPKSLEGEGGNINSFHEALAKDWNELPQGVKDWLKDNDEALQIWKQGTTKPDFLYYQPKDQMFIMDLSVTDKMRKMTRLVILKCKNLRSEGRVEEEWEWCLALYKCSRQIGKHGGDIERLQGMAMYANAVEAIVPWANDPQVNGMQLKNASTQLALVYRETALPSIRLKVGYMRFLNVSNGRDPEIDIFEGWAAKLSYFLLVAEPEGSQRLMKHAMVNWLSQSDLPRYQRTPLETEYFLFKPVKEDILHSESITNSELEKFAHKTFILFTIINPCMNYLLDSCDRERTRQAILITILAVQQYKRDHGHFPPDSAALIKGKYLKEIPLDGLQSFKAEIQYRHTPKQTVVYSLGDDGIDNDGNVDGNYYPTEGKDYGYILEGTKATDVQIDKKDNQ